MGKKCCVINCTSGYESQKRNNPQKVFRLFRFPQDIEQRKLWLRVLPNKIDTVLPNHRVCSDHFVNVQWGKSVNGSLIPLEPPNHFQGEPLSCVGTPNSYVKPRSTSRATASARAVNLNEMPEFRDLDSIKLSSFHHELDDRVVDSGVGLLAWGSDEDTFRIFSKSFDGPTHHFVVFLKMIDISNTINLNYFAYVKNKLISTPHFPHKDHLLESV